MEQNSMVALAPAVAGSLKIDLGCGKNKRGPDWFGVDARKFEGVDLVLNLCERKHDDECRALVGRKCDCPKILFNPWPWKDDSVDEVHASHFVEHLHPHERIHFANELYRVLKPGASATIVAPHWSSARAYGDMTHVWPPVAEFWFYYLKADWRAQNAPHNDEYTCNFDVTYGYNIPDEVRVRNQEYQMFAINRWKDVCLDIVSTWRKLT